jgi:hypothetical protein
MAAFVFLLLLQLPGMPGEKRYAKPAGDTSVRYIEFLEHNSHIIYPLLAIAVLGVLVLGILSAWRAQDIDGLAKAEFKREIIHELRKQMGGMSAEMLSKAVGLESLKLLRLLEEMQKDGLVMGHTNTQRLTMWRLKGIGPYASHGPPGR